MREVHVYGQSLAVGARAEPARPSTSAWARACSNAPRSIARAAGFHRLAVIAAVGTRLYYESRGFERGELYWVKSLKS